MIAYKVARIISKNEFVSAVAWGLAKTSYQIGVLTRVPEWLSNSGHYPLLFDKLSNVVRFIVYNHFMTSSAGRTQVLECDCQDSVSNIHLMDVACVSNGHISHSPLTACLPLPHGTVSYKAVVPRMVIQREDLFRGDGWMQNREKLPAALGVDTLALHDLFPGNSKVTYSLDVLTSIRYPGISYILNTENNRAEIQSRAGV